MLDLIRRQLASRGVAPTRRELCRLMGVRSTNGIHEHVLALEVAGYLSRTPLAERGLALTEKALARSPMFEERAA